MPSPLRMTSPFTAFCRRSAVHTVKLLRHWTDGNNARTAKVADVAAAKSEAGATAPRKVTAPMTNWHSNAAGEAMATPDPDPLSTGTHTLMAGGLAQRYHVYGSGPVCLAHPGGPGVFWEYLRMPAVEQHLTMVYIEAMGTGDSGRLATHPNGYTRRYYATVIGRLIDHLGQGNVYLLGHSYGGFVAQRYALDHPDRLAGLILCDSSPVTGDEHGAELIRQVQLFATRNADNPELPTVIAALQSMGSITDDVELTGALRALLPAYFADYWAREAEFASLRDHVQVNYISSLDADLVPDVIDDRAALPTLSTPTLVIAGRYDVICSVRWAAELHSLIPHSRLEILEKSGHFGHLEEPEAFTRAITDFVQENRGVSD
jgi:proline iminopeptidase